MNIFALTLKTSVRKNRVKNKIYSYLMRFDVALGLLEAFTQLIKPGSQCLQLSIRGRRLFLPVSKGQEKKMNLNLRRARTNLS